ncbi:MAG: isochorismate synthase, partial [Deltaproteobacteria bacterium]|nr:isochorismate synthase [Deltaproteobacteria bacterium]
DDVGFAGVGAVLAVRAHDAAELSSRATRALAEFDEHTLGRATAPTLRLLGGLPFSSSQSAGMFVLPRLRLATSAGASFLSLTLTADERADAVRRAQLLDLLLRAHDRLADAPDPASSPHVRSIDEGDTAAWEALVSRALHRIDQGELQKVVLARQTQVALESQADPTSVLAALLREAGWGARLLLAHDGETFVAVSPERLVRRSGTHVESEALAGTAAADELKLLASSQKDLAEHEVVIREIARALSPLCSSLSIAPQPGRRLLRHVAHLHTPIAASLRELTHVLELVQALHPTPAVGGVPRRQAVDFLVEGESQPRGLYAGPFGWFDARGDGDFWVGLRSGVLRDRTATVYAGAGIVRGSDPAAELRETRLKQRAFLRALGVSP